MNDGHFIPLRYDQIDSSRYSQNNPSAPTPDPYRGRESQLDRLPMQFITRELITQVTASQIPRLVTTRNWKRPRVDIPSMVMEWAIKEPRTALLLWMCGEVDSWPSAATVWPLEDRQLPFKEEDLIRIVQNPAQRAHVVEMQWKVAMRPLPRGGEHVEFQNHNTVPLRVEGSIGPRTSTLTKTLNKVKFLDGSDSGFYVRKRLEINLNRPQDKKAILSQIRQFHTLSHENITKIVSSYAQGLVVAFITPYMDSNLETHLDTDVARPETILNWVTDLSSALAFIHSQKVDHKSIRPQKILVDSNDRVYFSVFGVMLPVRTSYAHVYEKYSTDPAYIYAAPEVISRGSKVRWQLADVFSLGCVFFEMVGKAKGVSSEVLKDLRSKTTHDNSFHVNLACVLRLTKDLSTMKASSAAQRRARVVEGSRKVLVVIKQMLNAEPAQRPSMKDIHEYLSQPAQTSQQQHRRRRNSVGITALPQQSAIWDDLKTLQPWWGDEVKTSVSGSANATGNVNGYYDGGDSRSYWDTVP
jgi:serine/threonine protein kinase